MTCPSNAVAFDEAAAKRLYEEHLLEYPFTEKANSYSKTTPYSLVTEGTVEEVGGVLRPVVLKRFRGQCDTPRSKIAQRTYREAYAWAQIAKSPIQCENINTFRGVLFIDLSDVVLGVVDVTIPAIVTDYIRYDSIEYTCQRNPDQRLDIVRQLAKGVSHMHSLNMAHGDLKPDNFRVTEGGTAKLIDLGLSRLDTPQRTGFTTTVQPTFRFIAPELIKPGEEHGVYMSVTKQTDVYAFSMTALQILDGQADKSIPFNHCLADKGVFLALIQRQWPMRERYPGVKQRAWDILSSCWTEASNRPSVDTLLEEFSALQS